MCQWYGDLEPLEKEASEEPAVLRREIDMAAMMPEDWDQIMGGPGPGRPRTWMLGLGQ